MNSLERAEQLKAELERLRPLDAEREARVMQKLRLDWNFHSNNLEGNSLTYGETKALILFGITAQGKPLKDHFEITGHNEAINWILEIVEGKTELTEVFIRQLHQLLLKESYEIQAQTENEKPTKRRIEVGKYKTQPNHVITQTGETFYFAAPEETPAKMQELIDWFRREKEKPNTNPIILAALFHYKFIRIHPFDDGNGRVARILMNFILMRYGFPPVIIKTGDKENYFSVLQQADAGIVEPFVEYIARNLIRSLEIMIKGAKGESVEEPDDLDKELTLLEKSLVFKTVKNDIQKNVESINRIYELSILPFTNEFLRVCKKFDRFYSETNFHIELTQIKGTSPVLLSGKDIFDDFKRFIENQIAQVTYFYKYSGFNKNDIFDYSSLIYIHFGKNSYTLGLVYSAPLIEKLYTEMLSEKEIKDLVNIITSRHKEFIEEKLAEYERSA